MNDELNLYREMRVKTPQEFEDIKTKYRNLGFRVVTFLDSNQDKDINDGIKAVIKNHYDLFNGK